MKIGQVMVSGDEDKVGTSFPPVTIQPACRLKWFLFRDEDPHSLHVTSRFCIQVCNIPSNPKRVLG